MEQIFQQIDPALALWITVGCGLLCVVGFVLMSVLQFVGAGLEIVFSVFEFAGQIATGGPIAWCGCLVMMFGCAGCGGFIWIFYTVIPNCGTPQQLNLCRLLGY